MTHTSARIWQYLALIVIALAMGAGYWYFQVRAGSKLNSPQTGMLTSGLVGYWTFDGADTTSSVATDKSTSGNNGTLTNGPASISGKVGQALSFWPNGVDTQAYVNVGDPVSGALDFGSGDFSVGFWMKTSGYVDQSSSVNVPLSKTAVGTGHAAGYYFQYASSNLLQFVVRNGSSTYALSTPASIIGDWHYFMGVRSGSTMYLYQDGVSVGSTAVSGSTSNSEFFQMGSYGAGGPYFNVNGSMDEVRVYNRALAASEIQSLYDLGSSDKINSAVSQGNNALAMGLAGYWKFDDGSGSSATDSSTNGTTLTLTNSPSWSTGKIGSALTFFPSGSDTNALASVSDPASGVLDFGAGDFAVSFWAKGRGYTAQGSSGNMLVGKKNVDSSSAAGWYFGINSSSVPQMNVNNGSSEIYPGGGTALSDDAWHHLVGLRTGSTVKFYSDGLLVSSGTLSGSVSNVNSFWVGDDGTGIRNFKGEIDEVRTYNRSLSEDEISQLYRLTSPTGVDTSLKGYWSFNGADISGTTAYDRSGAGNNGTLNNGPTVTSGISGQALSFDGTDDSFGTSSLSYSAITVSGWFKTAQLPTSGKSAFIISKGTGTYPSFTDWWLEQYGADNNGKVVFWFEKSPTGPYQSAQFIPSLNTWYHFAVTNDGSTETFYINGTAIGTVSSYPLVNIRSTINLAAPQGGSAYGSLYYNGSIDEVRVYNRALSASEIQSLYRQGEPDKVNSSVSTPQGTGRLDSGLAGYWPLDDGSGTNSNDASTNNNDGTLTNGPTWGTGQIGSAVTFDGSNDYITVPDLSVYSPANAGSKGTISIWAKITNSVSTTICDGTGYTLASKGSSSGWEWQLSQFSNSGVCFIAYTSGGTGIGIASATRTMNDSQWHMYTGVIDLNSRVALYVDGVLADSDITLSGSMSDTSSTINLGARNNGATLFNGSLDEARYYNRILSDDEISQLYRLTSPTGVDTSLVGYWTFNGADISGTTAYDRSGAGNNGTLTNGPTVTPGKLGQALNFDGSDDMIDVGSSSNLDLSGANAFTLSAWVFPTSTPQGASVITEMFTPSSSTVQYEIGFGMNEAPGGSSYLKVGFYRDGSWRLAADSVNATLNAWTYIAGTWDGTNLSLYKNGSLVTATTPGSSLPSSYFDKVVIGSRHDAAGSVNYFPGKIDEVRIYNRSLSASEIAALYNSGR